jgi:hypothetical protein
LIAPAQEYPMAHMARWLPFWLNWLAVWGFVIGLLMGLYQIMNADRADKTALIFVESLSKESVLSRAFAVAYHLSSLVFGPRLISLRAFTWGIALSGGVFIIAFGIAVATTPNMQAELRHVLEEWNDTTFPVVAARWSIIGTILLTVTGILCEFLYVIKSRWIIRRITPTMPWYLTIVTLILDVSTTFALFFIIAPFTILSFSYFSMFLMGTKVEQDYISVKSANSSEFLRIGPGHSLKFTLYDQTHKGTPIELPLHNTLEVYRKLANGVFDTTMAHFDKYFREYHEVSTSARLKPGYEISYEAYMASHPNDPIEQYSKETGAHITSVGVGITINYLLTTMLVSASATTIWMVVCSLTLLAAKLIRAPKRCFVWLHRNKEKIWDAGVYIALLAVLGAAIVPLCL